MIDLQVAATNFAEYNFIDPENHNIMFAMISSNRAGYLLAKIRSDNDDEEGLLVDLMQTV